MAIIIQVDQAFWSCFVQGFKFLWTTCDIILTYTNIFSKKKRKKWIVFVVYIHFGSFLELKTKREIDTSQYSYTSFCFRFRYMYSIYIRISNIIYISSFERKLCIIFLYVLRIFINVLFISLNLILPQLL